MEKQPLRVAQVVGKVVLGGVDAMVMNFYRHMDRDAVQFDFFMDGEDPTPIDDEIRALGGRIYKLPAYERNLAANLSRFRAILRENAYPVLHCHLNTLSLFWLREGKRAGIPVRVAHSHSTIGKGEGVRNAFKYALRPFSRVYPTHCFACSALAGKDLFGERFYSSGQVRLVRNAIDGDAFTFDPERRARVRKSLDLEHRHVVGHVGRFMYQKNHSFLLEVFAGVLQKDPEALLLLIGEGPLLEEMRAKARSLGMAEPVRFLGRQKDIPRFLQAMDVFALPSHYEGLPVVGVEAQAAGLPLLLSDRVTEEAVLSGLCQRLPLDRDLWVQRILEAFPRTGERRSPHLPGYAIAEEAKRLEAFYTCPVGGFVAAATG